MPMSAIIPEDCSEETFKIGSRRVKQMTHGATQHMFDMKDVLLKLDEQSDLSRCCERGSQTDDSGGMSDCYPYFI